MNIEKRNISENELELTVKVSRIDATPYLIPAAIRIAQARTIKGFRPGKAPYEIVKREFGEEAIISEGLEEIVEGTLNQFLTDEKIRPYGQVGFNMLPNAPEDAVSFVAKVIVIPAVTLGDWTKQKIQQPQIKVTDDEITKAVDELAKMSAQEEPANRPAQKDDKLVVDFEVKVDGKIIDGGTATDFALSLGEGRMIPGFEDHLVGATTDQKLEFKLAFPTDYQAMELAGKEAAFTVTVKGVFMKTAAPIDDALAKKLGLENLDALRERMKQNITTEKQRDEVERLEIAAVKQIVETSTIGVIPKPMIDDAITEAVHDFEHNLSHQGMTMESYLKLSSKKIEDIRKDFEPKAINQIKTSLVLDELAMLEKLTITTAEIEEELEAQRRHFAQRPEVLYDLKQPEYRRHVANTLLNRKIVKFITEKIVV